MNTLLVCDSLSITLINKYNTTLYYAKWGEAILTCSGIPLDIIYNKYNDLYAPVEALKLAPVKNRGTGKFDFKTVSLLPLHK